MKARTKSNCRRAIVSSASKKIKSSRGETIVEALVSLIIAVISIALLVTSVTVASKINAKSKESTSEQLSFEYVDAAATALTGSSGSSSTSTSSATGTATTATIDFGDSTATNPLTVSPDITLYTTDNGYTYYMKN